MSRVAKAKSSSKDSTSNPGLEARLWLTADKLRNNMDAADWSGATKTAAGSPEGAPRGANQYKLVVLGLIFLKYISETFEEHRAKFLAGAGDYDGANPDEYKAENVFWVPAEARWSFLQANVKQSTIGKLVDDAMVAIERDMRFSVLPSLN